MPRTVLLQSDGDEPTRIRRMDEDQPGGESARPAPHAPQNIYDDPAFFAGYAELRREERGLNAVLEQPAIRTLLPDLDGRSVLDLGTGMGGFARYARERGARRVVALDVSARMLDEARRLTNDPDVEYVHAPLESYEPAAGAFDIAVSSLTLHYVQDYASIVARVHQALVPGGWFVFSVEHPVVTASPSGWVSDAAGRRLHWPVDNYGDEGNRSVRWFVDGVIKYHRTVATYLNTLIETGYAIRRIAEPAPDAAAIAARPSLEQDRRVPPFLLVAAQR